MELPNEIWDLILSKTDNYYCLGICKSWYDIIIKHSEICKDCGKVVKMYDTVLWINDPSDTICHGYYESPYKYRVIKEILWRDNKFLTLIKRKCLGLWLCAVQYSTFPYDHIKNIPDSWYMHAIKINPEYIKYLKNPTYEMYLKGVKKCGEFVKHVPIQHHTYKLCMVAILNSKNALPHIKFQSEEFWLNYIKSVRYLDKNILKYVLEPTEDIVLEVYRRNGMCGIEYIQYPKMQ
jgi:hypothetical protein